MPAIPAIPLLFAARRAAEGFPAAGVARSAAPGAGMDMVEWSIPAISPDSSGRGPAARGAVLFGISMVE